MKRLSGWNDTIEAWVQRHDVLLDLITVWSIAVGTLIGALVFGILWWVMKRQKEPTPFGRALRAQWGAMSLSKVTLATLFFAALWAYYAERNPLDLWAYLAVRMGLAVTSLWAAFAGLRALVQLRRDSRTVLAPEGGTAVIDETTNGAASRDGMC